jgi:hypothetical protein
LRGTAGLLRELFAVCGNCRQHLGAKGALAAAARRAPRECCAWRGARAAAGEGGAGAEGRRANAHQVPPSKGAATAESRRWRRGDTGIAAAGRTKQLQEAGARGQRSCSNCVPGNCSKGLQPQASRQRRRPARVRATARKRQRRRRAAARRSEWSESKAQRQRGKLASAAVASDGRARRRASAGSAHQVAASSSCAPCSAAAARSVLAAAVRFLAGGGDASPGRCRQWCSLVGPRCARLA